MSVAGLITVVVVLVCLAAVLAPFLIDGRHWWHRKRK
jgi:hypothetical protein